jgi:hypothetical protein
VAKICFIVMPFGHGDEYDGKREEADFVYNDIIRPAVVAAVGEFKKQYGDQIEHGLTVVRELENVAPGAVTASIVRHIAESHITIVDLTGRNPNVFLELGIRFALRRNGTILLVQDAQALPFNVAHFRVVEYRPRFGGIERARSALTATVLATLSALAQPSLATTDSLVFDALPNLKISGLGFIEESPTPGRVSWDEYWGRVAQIQDVLNELQATGVYKPDLIIGISNGGLFLADTTLRLVYKNDVPMMALWAQRSKDEYFDNLINNALIDEGVFKALIPTYTPEGGNPPEDGRTSSRSFSRNLRASRRMRVLVMDDIVGTQRTFLQLVAYLKKRLGSFYGQIEIRFVFLFTPRSETVDALSDYLLSNDAEIARQFKNIELEAVTGKSDLPYRKSIHFGSITKSDSTGVEAITRRDVTAAHDSKSVTNTSKPTMRRRAQQT